MNNKFMNFVVMGVAAVSLATSMGVQAEAVKAPSPEVHACATVSKDLLQSVYGQFLKKDPNSKNGLTLNMDAVMAQTTAPKALKNMQEIRTKASAVDNCAKISPTR